MRFKSGQQSETSSDAAKQPSGSFTSAFLKCIACFKLSDVMFQGSSYCETCLKERLRLGTI